MVKAMPYAQSGRNDYQWTSRAFDLCTNGLLTVNITGHGEDTAVQATGECPRCTHDVHYTHLEKIVLPADASTLGDGDQPEDQPGPLVDTPQGVYVPLDVACACQNEHPGRPTTTPNGCGIVFSVEVLVTT